MSGVTSAGTSTASSAMELKLVTAALNPDSTYRTNSEGSPAANYVG